MISPALGRAVRAPGSIPTGFACTLGRVAAAQQTLTPRTRRYSSSSKPSIPPNGSSRSRSEEQAASTKPDAAKADATKAAKVTGKASKKKAAVVPAPNVPRVAATDYLEKSQVKLSSFFSLHRPMSLSSSIPNVATAASFDAIFAIRPPNSRRSMMDNIGTLSGGIESLEAALRSHDPKTENVLEDIHHLDGPPEISLDDIMSKLTPFSPPPAPLPLGQIKESEAFSMQPENALDEPLKQRSWSTRVVVTESTDSSGNRTYSTNTAPMVEIRDAENNQDRDEYEIRQPFLERMRQRGESTDARYRDTQVRPDMMAISVKRQRKLKMKKHKYKKLMKRTRLLRRKLDRL